MKLTIVAITGGLIATLSAGAAHAQATVEPLSNRNQAPSVNVPLCPELAFDAGVFIRELQLELADHRAHALAEGVPDQADPSGLALAVDADCGAETEEVVIRIAHRETGHGTLSRVVIEGEGAEERGRRLALATVKLLWERWAELGRPEFVPVENPYRLATFEGTPANPYLQRLDRAPSDNPYRYAPPATSTPATAPGGEHDVHPVNPYLG